MKYTESHEWIEIEDGVATVGVTDYAQQELGDIVYVELPSVGKSIEAGDEAAVLESTKAAADVYTPISGEIVEVNEILNDNPEIINSAANGEGWLFRLKPIDLSELDELMDEETYMEKIRTE